MKVACIGAGPGGLFFATLLKRSRPDAEVVVFERNRPDDTFGFGVVFSDATLDAIDAADPVLSEALEKHGRHWDDIEVRVHGRTGARRRHGHGGRRPQDAAEPAAGTGPRRGRSDALPARGPRSRRTGRLRPGRGVRRRQQPLPHLVRRRLRTDRRGGEREVHLVRHHVPVRRAHLRPPGRPSRCLRRPRLSDQRLAEHLHRRDRRRLLGQGRSRRLRSVDPAGHERREDQGYLEDLFREQIDGHPLVGNNSRWANFATRRARSWRRGNVGAAGRRGAHRALLRRVRHQDGHGGRGRAGRGPGGGAATACRRHWRSTRSAAAPRSRGSRTRRGPACRWWEHFGRYVRRLRRSDAVRLPLPHPQHPARQTRRARRGVRGPRRRMVAATPRGGAPGDTLPRSGRSAFPHAG